MRLSFSLFSSGREQAGRTDNFPSSAVVTNAGAPKRSILSSLLYSHFTHGCIAKYDRDHIIKFAGRKKLMEGLQNNDESFFSTDRSLWSGGVKIKLI